MTDRDHFAAAALTGLLFNGDYSMESIPRHAFSMADAMLRERERTNHDAAPAARADLPDESPPNAVSANRGTRCAASRDGSGTGDTPVTEPMPKEKLAEVSDGWRRDIRPPDAADRALAAACDKAWGIAAEPVAWGLPNADGDEIWATSLNKEAIERHCPTNQTLVPLYRHPHFTLTDAEREAVRFFSQIDGPHNVPVANKRAATLRGLLERLK